MRTGKGGKIERLLGFSDPIWLWASKIATIVPGNPRAPLSRLSPPWNLTDRHELLAVGVNICASCMTPAYHRPLRPNDSLGPSIHSPLEAVSGQSDLHFKSLQWDWNSSFGKVFGL